MSVAMRAGRVVPSLAIGAFVTVRLQWVVVSTHNSLEMLVLVSRVTGAQRSSPFVLAHPNDGLVVELVP